MIADMARVLCILSLVLASASGCAPSRCPREVPVVAASASAAVAEKQVGALLDAWHAAAAAADEARYFGLLTDDSVFLGTDATERWSKPEFLAFAHPFFARGKAWSFRATERHVTVDPDGALAWFDEALATPNLGPCRGSGVARREAGGWRVVHYNLAITVPNDRMSDVKRMLEAAAAPGPSVAPLAPMVGAWRVDGKNPETGAPFELDYRITPMLDGAWLRGVGSAPRLGLHIEDVWGKDPRTGEIVRVLFDSLGTFATVRSKGWVGPALVLEGEATGADGKSEPVRETLTRVSEDELRAVWESRSGGAWKTYSVETLRRRK